MRRILFIVLLTTCVTTLEAQMAWIIDSDGTNHLWTLNLSTGVATDIGAITGGYPQIEGLATSPGGVLYGVDDSVNTLVTINTSTAVATPVGSGNGNLGVDVSDVGLTFDGAGNLWLTAETGNDFYSVNPATGVATLINGSQAVAVTGLGACGTTIYGMVDGQIPELVTIDPVSGATTSVGPLGVSVPDDGGLAMVGNLLWGIADDSPSRLFTINRSTGAATFVADVTDGTNPITGIEGFATADEPAASCAATGDIPLLDGKGLLMLAALIATAGVWLLQFNRAS